MNPAVTIYIIEVIGFLLIGWLSIANSKTKIHKTFFAFTICLSLWQGLQLVAIIVSNNDVLSHGILMTSVFFSTVAASLVASFVAQFTKRSRSYVFYPYIAICFGLFAYFSPSLRDVSITHAGIGIPQLDLYYGIVLLCALAFMLISIKNLTLNLFIARQAKVKEQSVIILSGVGFAGLAAILGSFDSNILPKVLDPQNVIPLAGLFATYALLYAMTYKGFLDIRLAAVRAIVYMLSLILLASMYIISAYIISFAFSQNGEFINIASSNADIAVALLFALAFQPIKSFFDKKTNKYFYRNHFNSDDFYAQLSDALTSTTDVKKLLERASEVITLNLKVKYGIFSINVDESRRQVIYGSNTRTIRAVDLFELEEYVKKDRPEILVNDLIDQDSDIHSLLTKNNISIVLPLMKREGTLVGLLLIGEKLLGRYTNSDIKVLRAISDELLIAIQNAVSVKELKDINQHLEQRIQAATTELRSSNDRLKRLDQAKNEFLSMASHQLRTPLTSVKGYISMVLEGDAGKVSSDQKKLLSEAFTSSERMVHLINDFLNVSRIQTGKFVIERINTDLTELVKQEAHSLQSIADSRGLTLKVDVPSHKVIAAIDEGKIRQVLMNYIDNAIYYAKPDGKITVKLTDTTQAVLVEVIDDGIGVPMEQQKKLFEKFFRAENAKRQRPDGTGVGLFLAKKVIDGHGGKIIFKSREGHGSTFGFSLPAQQTKKTDQ